MKTITLAVCLLLATLSTQFVFADLVGPYTPDPNTLVLLHLDEAAGGSVTANAGSLGQNFYTVNYASASATPPLVTTMLGGTGFSSGAVNFNNCENNTTAGYELGFDYNGNGQYDADSGTGTSVDFLPMSKLNIGNGGQTPFTLEALIQPTTTAGNQEIICTDSDAGSRAFQFRITSGALQFQFITGSQAATAAIPTSGSDAFTAGTWYHVAMVYDGSKATLYWTKLDPSVGAAHVLGTPASLTLGASDGAVTGPLAIGNRGRPSGTETFLGGIDEVRISSVARAANQMQFYSPLVTVTQNPVSQNVDYNQPVTFTVGASSLTPLGYQWRFNSNSIPGVTNASYVITNVAAANGGYYDVVVTNTAGYAATSSPALLIVGAANFLNHRYSFTTDDTDSISGANGTNFGDAFVTNGALVLDGIAGTFMQLPGNLFNAANATALTVEFWASYGANANNAYVFALGYTNVIAGAVVGIDYVCYSPHNASGQGLLISPSDSSFQQSVTAPGTLDGLTYHVACVIDPPNKTLAIYTNGVLEAINTNLTVNLANVNDALSYIGQSLFAADPYLVANIDELRLYKGALSALSIQQSDIQGPNVVLASGPVSFVAQPVGAAVPVGQTATFTAAAVGYLPITYQWFISGTPVPGATNASYSFVPTLADNNSSIQVYATNTIGVTTYVTNSSTVTLTVFVPPTLAWLDAADGGADSSWNTTSLDWINAAGGGGVTAFAQTNGVLFDNRGSGSPVVDIEQAIIPYNITVNASTDYLLTSSGNAGLLVGQGSITKLNSDTLTIDLTNSMAGATTISGGKLQVGNGDFSGTLGSGPVTNNATLSFNRADTVLLVPNAIHGNGTVSFDGSGAVTISGASDYTGGTLMNAGIVYLTSSTGLGAASTGTTVANGAQLYITGNMDVSEDLTLNGAGDSNGALRKGGAGATTDYGAVTLASDSTIGVDTGATLTLSNIVSGTAGLTASGGGTLTFGTNNSFSGGFTLNGPVVDLNTSGALGTGPVTVIGAGRFVIGDGLNLTNFILASAVSPATGYGLLMVNDNTNGTVTTVSGPLEFDASPASGGDFVGPTSSGYLNVTGPITNAATGVVASRAGFVRFSGGGNYAAFSLNQGTTSIGANNGLCTNAALSVAVSADATFDLNGFNQTLAGLSDGATFQEWVTNSASSPCTLTLNLSVNNTYSGVIAGNLALVENGSANVYLAGTNAYTGNTTVNGGTLELAQPSLAANSAVTVANGAVLQLDFTVTNTVAGLVLNGVSQPLGVYNSTTSSTYLTGAGSLQVAMSVAANPTNIVARVSGNNLNLSWPADHIGWRLLMQTNNLAKGISANINDWGTVGRSTGTNQVNLAIDPARPAEFYRLVYP